MNTLNLDGSTVFVSGIRIIMSEADVRAGALGRFASAYCMGERL